MPVVSISSPPESHGVGSSSSEMWTQRTGDSAACVPATRSRPSSSRRLWTVSIQAAYRRIRCPASASTSRRTVVDFLELLGVRDQRRRELDDRVAAVVGAADQAAAVELAGEEAAQQLLGLLVVEALLGVLVLDQLDRLEVAGAAHVADDRQVAEAVEHPAELALLGEDVAGEVLALEDVEVGHRDRRRHRVAGEGEAVREGGVALHERLGDAVGGDQRPHRRVGGGDRLRHRDDVGDVLEAVAAEVVAEPAPGADHLVGDHQHVVAVADLAHPLEVALGRDEAAAGVLDRLEDHRGDRLGPLEFDPLLDRVRRPERVAVLGPAVDVGVGDVAAARGERLELGAQLGDAGRREGAERGAVVGDLTGDHLVLLAVAAHPVEVARELQRRLDRLRAAGGEEDPVEVAGGERGDPRRQLDRARVRVAPQRVEVELLDLAGGGLAELGAAVAGVDAEEAGEAVEVAVAVLVVDVAALAADDDRDLVVVAVGAHSREVHPEMSPGLLLKAGPTSAARLRRDGHACLLPFLRRYG